MKKFSYFCRFLIFGFLFMRDVSCKKVNLGTKAEVQKIVGGYEINIKDVPYQVRLTIETNDGVYYGCGGSIISRKFVLTAAHCLELPSGAKTVYVRAGSNYREKGGEVYASTRFWQHPDYHIGLFDNDVAIVRLDKPIVFNSNTQAIKLAKSGTNVPVGTEILATGWGRISENGQESDKLMGVKVPVVSNQNCSQNYNYISENMICAGVPEGGNNVCKGDSGGPAQSEYGQIGIVSFGVGCARPGYPGVFARVSSPRIRNWIKRITGV